MLTALPNFAIAVMANQLFLPEQNEDFIGLAMKYPSKEFTPKAARRVFKKENTNLLNLPNILIYKTIRAIRVQKKTPISVIS